MRLLYQNLLLAFVALCYILGFFWVDRWETFPRQGDAVGYYFHVVALLVNNDTGDYEKTMSRLLEDTPESQNLADDPYLIRETSIGRKYIKYTVGAAVMEVPFFLGVHSYMKIFEADKANGYGKNYYFVIAFSTVIYVLIGFWLLISTLSKHFKPLTVVLATLSIALATNLFFQATYVTMVHSFLFFDYCLLIYLTDRFFDRPNRWKALAIGLVVGLITITRVPEIISILIPLFWGVTNLKSFRERVQFFIQNYGLLIFAAIGLLLVVSLQLGYWYYTSGKLIFNPYEGEGFNFLKPNIWLGFFDFKNGWLIYTPIMAFSLIGFAFLKRYYASPLIPIIGFILLHTFIHYSYYAWTYFPGLGQRPMVETYALLAFPLAACWQYFLSKKYLVWIPFVAVGFFSWHNLFQTWQMREGIIWSERGNQAFYTATFGQSKGSWKSLVAFDINESQPDTNRLELIEVIAQEDFEGDAFKTKQTQLFYNGENAYYLNETSNFELIPVADFPEGTKKGDWIGVSLWAHMRKVEQFWDRYGAAHLNLALIDDRGVYRNTYRLSISSHIGNEQHSIWSAGTPDQWGEAKFFVRVKKWMKPDWKVVAFIDNYQGQRLFVDDFELGLFRRK